MTDQQQMRDFVVGIVGMLWLGAPLYGPFVLLWAVLRFLRWLNSTARGQGDVDDLVDGYQGTGATFEQRRAVFRDGAANGFRQAARSYHRRTRQ